MDTEPKTSNSIQQDQQGSTTAVPQFEETKEQTSPLKNQDDLTEQMGNLKLNDQEKKDSESNKLEGNRGDSGAKSDDEIVTRKIEDVNLSSSDESENNSPATTTDKKGELTIDGKVYKIKEAPNLFFYSNKMKSKPYGTYIKTMHEQWRGNYDRLEDDHSYIQWLFPNFYQSAFNSAADPLTKEEAECFRTNPALAQTLVKSYELILDFYGMKLVNSTTGDIERSENFAPRYKDALLTYYHNHLRMRRILTHLNNVGFRRYAVKLVDFMEKEIYGEIGGYVKYENDAKDFNKKAFESAPLKKLAKVSGTFPIWRLYGDHKNDPKKIAALEKNCFSKYPEEFVESVFFKY